MPLAPRIFIAIFVALLAAAILLIPMHGALLAANYLVYFKTGHAATVLTHALDPFYQLQTYQGLVKFWLQHTRELPLFQHTLPLIGIPTGIGLLSLVACYRFVRTMKDRFSD